MHMLTLLYLHSPHSSPASIEDHVVGLVLANWFGHAESAIRSLDHELHLGHIAAMLAGVSSAGCGPLLFR
jgi:predicted esterase YcpF (UPF0227 family)